MLDCVYVAASTLDARLTRICIASIRYFYPQLPVRLLIGGALQPGLRTELERLWDVGVAPIPPGNYGWGFVKLEPLFGTTPERFLMMDSDTVMTGPVIDQWSDFDADFLVPKEEFPAYDVLTHFYDWTRMRADDPAAAPPQFLFNTGHWVGRAGAVSRADFDGLIRWGQPPELQHPDRFFPGEQGVLNYVLNRKAARGEIRIDRRPFAVWPGFGLDVTAGMIAERTAPPLIVHWAGLKKRRHRDMVGADLLDFFEDVYYKRGGFAGIRRAGAGVEDAVIQQVDRVRRSVKRRWASVLHRPTAE